MALSTLLILVVIGVVAGMLSGLVGVGGGIIIVPALMWALGFTQHQATGTSLAILLLPVGILAVWNYHKAGNIDWQAALIISATFVVGAYFGSKLSLSLPPETVKKVFGGVMILAALKLIFGK
jgi:uncharacterized membrane protein YfcA